MARPAGSRAASRKALAADTAAKAQNPQRHAKSAASTSEKPNRRLRLASLPSFHLSSKRTKAAISANIQARNDVAASAPVPDAREPRSHSVASISATAAAVAGPEAVEVPLEESEVQRENSDARRHEDEHAPDGVKSDSRVGISGLDCGRASGIDRLCVRPASRRAPGPPRHARSRSTHASRFAPHASRGPDQDDERRDAPRGEHEGVRPAVEDFADRPHAREVEGRNRDRRSRAARRSR